MARKEFQVTTVQNEVDRSWRESIEDSRMSFDVLDSLALRSGEREGG